MKSWTMTRFLKALTGLLILAFVFVMVVLFIRRAGGTAAVVPIKTDRKPDEVAASRDIRHLEVTKGERGNFEINADSHFLGEDGRYHLEGNVKYISFREEGMEINAEKADYDLAMTQFNLSGRVILKQDDFSVISADVVYDSNTEVFSTTSGVRFEADRLTGSSQNLSYNVSQKKLLLDTDVDMTILPGGDESAPIRIESDSFEYSSGLKTGTFGGGISLERGQDSAQAESLSFKLVQTEERIRDLVFKGGVEIVYRSGAGESAWDSSYFKLPTEKVVINAEELTFRGFPDLPLLHQVMASGGCRFLFSSHVGTTTQIGGDEVRFFLTRDGELREFSAVGRAILSERDGSGKNIRSVEGTRLILKGQRGILTAQGGNLSVARFFSESQDITADSIIVDLKKSDLEAQGGLKMVLSGGDDRPGGLFKKGAPVFITAGEMRYSDSRHRFIFKKDVKAWQDRQQLFSQEFIMDTESQEIWCYGKVSTTFVSDPEEGLEGERISIAADDMVYNPVEKVLLFQNEGVLRVKSLEVKAPAIAISFKEEGGIRVLTASGGVTFQSERHDGRSDYCEYDLAKETIVFTGNPVINDKEKGTLQGDKLTFRLSDDKIIVENFGLRRSITIIKS